MEVNLLQDFIPDQAYCIFVQQSEPDASFEKNKGVSDLISKGQKVIIHPQTMDRSHEQLCGYTRIKCRLRTRSIPEKLP